jgi:glutathione synthase/RimK-type ligase-like ATP-grasp enzyme
MKKIGVLHGKENTFPDAFVERINAKNIKGIHAERTFVEELMQGEPSGYAVMIDRISQDVPFYRAYLKNAALNGTAVCNNPFWWSADEKFFNNCLSTKIGMPVPKTVLLPSKQMPPDTSGQSFRNMKYPLDWERIIEYLGGFPLYMKPHDGGGWKNVYKVHNFDEFFAAYNETGTLNMMVQECVDFTSYFRCYCLGGKAVRIMDYEPRNPHHLRYVADFKVGKDMKDLMTDYVLRINHALGYDFNTVEFAIRDGIPMAIDFCNPAPDADLHSVGEENFEWVVENAANMAIEKAQKHKDNADNLTWGTYIAGASRGFSPSMPLVESVAKKKK